MHYKLTYKCSSYRVNVSIPHSLEGVLQDVKAASAAVGVTLEVVSLDVIMSATQDRHQSAAGQPPTAPS